MKTSIRVKTWMIEHIQFNLIKWGEKHKNWEDDNKIN